ncbi:MAG: thermonuclease family protein [Planctomycetaceae bacterium]|nr:thermonuclease family protein [Planctomycetaceae bacterium]
MCSARFPFWPEWSPPLPPGVYRVVTVDGELISLSNHQTNGFVKLLGIELTRNDAESYLRQRLLGQLVRLRFDRRRIDLQRIQLAYVYLDKTLINSELVRQGYARAATQPDDYPPIRREIEATSEDQGLGRRGIPRPESE